MKSKRADKYEQESDGYEHNRDYGQHAYGTNYGPHRTTVVVTRSPDYGGDLCCSHAIHCCITAFFPPWALVWMGCCLLETLREPEVTTTTYVTNAPPVFVRVPPPASSPYF